MQRISIHTALFVALLMGAALRLDAQQKPTVTHTATMVTTLGTIELELYGNDAPKTVNNFTGLAGRKFFEGIIFHRVVPGFVIQAGDPKTKNPALREEWGTGGESIYNNEEFADEVNPASPSRQRGYVEGALAMANHGPNTNSSQFFIVTSTQGASGLAAYNTYTIFGMVTRGLDVVHTIEQQGQATEVKITSVTVSAVVNSGAVAGSQQRTPSSETAQQFWKRFQTALKKGRKNDVADAFLFTTGMDFWANCESGNPPTTREGFLRCYNKIFTPYAQKSIAKAAVQREALVECSEGYRGEGYSVRFLTAPTQRDRQGKVYKSEQVFTAAQINGQWKIICASAIGQND